MPNNPNVELSETLKVVNWSVTRDGRPQGLRLAWNSRKYDLAPNGGECYIPFDCVKLYFGDPRTTEQMRTLRDSIGIVSFLPDRPTEVRRLRLLYAAPFGEYLNNEDLGGIYTVNPTDAMEVGKNAAFEGVHVPKVEVYNMQGERIYTVLDDPQGLDTIPVPVTGSFRDDMAALVQRQAALIDTLARKVGIDPTDPGALLNAPNLTGEEEEASPSPEELQPASATAPSMVYDPRDGEMKPRRKPRPQTPTSLDDIPEDRI